MKEVGLLWVGIDVGSQAHQVCVLDSNRQVRMQRAFEHSSEGLAKLADELVGLAGGDPSRLTAALEVPWGAVVETLMERGIAVFSLNPKQLDRFRDRHSVAGAKDDRRDAFVLADALRTDEPQFRRIQVSAVEVVQLRELSRMHEELTAEVVALGNRLREQLHRFWPQLLTLGSVYDELWLWELLELGPTPAQARHIPLAKVRAVLVRHRIRRLQADVVLQALRTPPLRVAPGVIQASTQHIAMLLPRLRLADAQRRECVRQMDALLTQMATQPSTATASTSSEPVVDTPSEPLPHEHRDARILLSLPGVGTIVGATMLAEASQLLERRDYHSLRAQAGVAPVTRQSGKSTRVLMRRACNPRLRQAVYHWARISVRYEPRSREQYAQLRAKGHRQGRALRGVADRLLSVLIAMLRHGHLYDSTCRSPAGHAQAPSSVAGLAS